VLERKRGRREEGLRRLKEIISLRILRIFGAEAAPKIRVGKRNYEKVAPVDSQFLFPSSH
jgi:hypothetical protein